MMNYLKLIRYKNLVMILFTIVLIQFSIIKTNLKWLHFSLFILATLLLTASGYVINDLLDVKADKINKPKSYLVTNTIPKKRATIFAILLLITGFIIGLYVAFQVNVSHILFLLIPFVGVVIYSFYLKRIAILGNIIIALCSFWIYPMVYLFFKKDKSYDTIFDALSGMFDEIFITTTLVIYGFLSFFITLIREILKDIEDVDGDFNVGMKTLPVLIGIKRSRNLSMGISLIFTLFIVTLCKFLFDDGEYTLSVFILIFIFIPMLYFIYTLWNANSKKEFSYLSNFLKVIMLFGIMSMFFLSSF